MVQANESQDVEGLRSSYRLFEDLVGYLEKGAADYAATGSQLEQSVNASLVKLRANVLPMLAQVVEDYASCAQVGKESPGHGKAIKCRLDSMSSFSELTYALNIELAEAYEAMPAEARALVPLRRTFQQLVERKLVYGRLLMESRSRSDNQPSLTNIL